MTTSTFREDVEKAIAHHGHLCSGQCSGTKMARYGMQLIGINPATDRKKMIVFVENDRCLADAVSTVTGCNIGKRSLKFKDYGKSAASFLNLSTGKAIRICKTKHLYPPEGQDMIDFYDNIPNEELFEAREVKISLLPSDLPGKPIEAVFCENCGEDVTDSRHILKEGKVLCKACAEGAYYTYV